MIQQTIHRLLKHRHFWRDVSFSELSEIYISMMFRSLSISLTNIFVPVYMLHLHYAISAIMLLFFWYFLFRGLVFDIVAGYITARIGPKHTIILSYGVLVLANFMLSSLHSVHWPLWLVGALWGGATSLFAIPYHVDFSKIKHKAHGGKELGYANMMEKTGYILGPILSGLVATLFGGQYIFWVAIVVLVLGSIPLLRTAEPVPTRQHFSLKHVKSRIVGRDVFSFMFFGIELTLCGWLWPLYLGVFVLIGSTAYAKLGFIASSSVLISIAMAYLIGKLADNNHGRSILRFGVSANAVLHALRPLVTTYPLALVANVANEAATVAYRIPYTKGMYDAGDTNVTVHRIAYFVAMEGTSSIAKATVWLFLAACTGLFSVHALFVLGFGLAAMASLLISSERFVALNVTEPKPNIVYAPVATKPL